MKHSTQWHQNKLSAIPIEWLPRLNKYILSHKVRFMKLTKTDHAESMFKTQ